MIAHLLLTQLNIDQLEIKLIENAVSWNRKQNVPYTSLNKSNYLPLTLTLIWKIEKKNTVLKNKLAISMADLH